MPDQCCVVFKALAVQDLRQPIQRRGRRILRGNRRTVANNSTGFYFLRNELYLDFNIDTRTFRLIDVDCVIALFSFPHYRVADRTCITAASLVASFVGPWWLLGGSLVAPWWFLGGSFVAPWWVRGGSLVAPWWLRLLSPAFPSLPW